MRRCWFFIFPFLVRPSRLDGPCWMRCTTTTATTGSCARPRTAFSVLAWRVRAELLQHLEDEGRRGKPSAIPLLLDFRRRPAALWLSSILPRGFLPVDGDCRTGGLQFRVKPSVSAPTQI